MWPMSLLLCCSCCWAYGGYWLCGSFVRSHSLLSICWQQIISNDRFISTTLNPHWTLLPEWRWRWDALATAQEGTEGIRRDEDQHAHSAASSWLVKASSKSSPNALRLWHLVRAKLSFNENEEFLFNLSIVSEWKRETSERKLRHCRNASIPHRARGEDRGVAEGEGGVGRGGERQRGKETARGKSS